MDHFTIDNSVKASLEGIKLFFSVFIEEIVSIELNILIFVFNGNSNLTSLLD